MVKPFALTLDQMVRWLRGSAPEGLHDDRCATRKGYACNCASAAFDARPTTLAQAAMAMADLSSIIGKVEGLEEHAARLRNHIQRIRIDFPEAADARRQELHEVHLKIAKARARLRSLSSPLVEE